MLFFFYLGKDKEKIKTFYLDKKRIRFYIIIYNVKLSVYEILIMIICQVIKYVREPYYTCFIYRLKKNSGVTNLCLWYEKSYMLRNTQYKFVRVKTIKSS